VQGFHIRDALAVVASQHPNLISKYGGHAMAAGLTLPEEHFHCLPKPLMPRCVGNCAKKT
jgi:single-stranded DNA-specific DHH superfamily exonuclease